MKTDELRPIYQVSNEDKETSHASNVPWTNFVMGAQRDKDGNLQMWQKEEKKDGIIKIPLSKMEKK